MTSLIEIVNADEVDECGDPALLASPMWDHIPRIGEHISIVVVQGEGYVKFVVEYVEYLYNEKHDRTNMMPQVYMKVRKVP